MRYVTLANDVRSSIVPQHKETTAVVLVPKGLSAPLETSTAVVESVPEADIQIIVGSWQVATYTLVSWGVNEL